MVRTQRSSAVRSAVIMWPQEDVIALSPRKPRGYAPPASPQTLLKWTALGALSALEERYAPEVLYLAGDAALLGPHARRVAVVGSREASPEGIRRSAKLAGQLASEGVVIVSGLARGIDRAAHEAAIQARGRTIAVLGTSLDRCSPIAHAPLQEEIYRAHLLVSQFPPEVPTHKSDFVKRNRTMALLSHASVIVEAGEGSGTLSQAAETQRLGRPLFIMQSVLERRDLSWPQRFLEAGAQVLTSADQVLGAVGSPRSPH